MATWVCRLELGRLGGVWGCLFPLELKVNLQKVVISFCVFICLRTFPRKGHDDGGARDHDPACHTFGRHPSEDPW